MALPFFYIPSYNKDQQELILDEDNSRHIVQVLRMKIGEKMQLTDGKGNLLTVRISSDHMKKCVVRVEDVVAVPSPGAKGHYWDIPVEKCQSFRMVPGEGDGDRG